MSESLAEVMSQHSEGAELGADVARICSEAKGTDVTLVNVKRLSDISDFLVISSGRSDRHVQGICNRIIETLAARGLDPINVEGLEKGHWVVLDYGEVVVHVFYEPLREHYNIEGLWARAPRITLPAVAQVHSMAAH